MSGQIFLSADEVAYMVRLHVAKMENVERIKGVEVNAKGEATVFVDLKNPAHNPAHNS